MKKHTRVPEVSIRRDMRFTIDQNWEDTVLPAIAEAKERGVLVTPLTVFDDWGIVGWYLHGWVPPPGRVLYSAKNLETVTPCPKTEEKPFINDYSI